MLLSSRFQAFWGFGAGIPFLMINILMPLRILLDLILQAKLSSFYFRRTNRPQRGSQSQPRPRPPPVAIDDEGGCRSASSSRENRLPQKPVVARLNFDGEFGLMVTLWLLPASEQPPSFLGYGAGRWFSLIDLVFFILFTFFLSQKVL